MLCILNSCFFNCTKLYQLRYNSQGEGPWMIFNFLIIHVYFVFCLLYFIIVFLYLIEYCHIMFIIILFWLVSDRPSGLLFFVLALLLSILTPLFLPSSGYLISFLLFPNQRECWGEHSCTSHTFSLGMELDLYALWRQWRIRNPLLLN